MLLSGLLCNVLRQTGKLPASGQLSQPVRLRGPGRGLRRRGHRLFAAGRRRTHGSGNHGEHGAGGASREVLHIGRVAQPVFTVVTPDDLSPNYISRFYLVGLIQALYVAHGLNDKRNCFRAPYKQVWIKKGFFASCRLFWRFKIRRSSTAVRGVQHSIEFRSAALVKSHIRSRFALSHACDTSGSTLYLPVGFRRVGMIDRRAAHSAAPRGRARRSGEPDTRCGLPRSARSSAKHVSNSNQRAMRMAAHRGAPQQKTRRDKDLNLPGISVAISYSQRMRRRPAHARGSQIREGWRQLSDCVGAAGKTNASYEGTAGPTKETAFIKKPGERPVRCTDHPRTDDVERRPRKKQQIAPS